MGLDFYTHWVVESSDVREVEELGYEIGLRDVAALVAQTADKHPTADHYWEGIAECQTPVEDLQQWPDENVSREAATAPNVEFDWTELANALHGIRLHGEHRAHRAAAAAIADRRAEWETELQDEIDEIDPDDFEDDGTPWHGGGEPPTFDGAVAEAEQEKAERLRGMDDMLRLICETYGVWETRGV